MESKMSGNCYLSIATVQSDGSTFVFISRQTPLAPLKVASEIMAVLALAKDLSDMRERLGAMIVARSKVRSKLWAKTTVVNAGRPKSGGRGCGWGRMMGSGREDKKWNIIFDLC